MIKKMIIVCVVSILCIVTILFFLMWNGIILLNNPSHTQYPVRGVDVSAYQGKINWDTLSKQNLSFVFIKATEGSSFVDPCFDYNYTEAQKTNLRVGAYHFFSYDSEGQTQADNFIRTVKKSMNMLPPVIDLEFYGDKEKNLPEATNVRTQLDEMLDQLEDFYGIKPIIYATEKSYSLYLANSHKDYDIWIRNVITSPKLTDSRKWTFWQYTNRERLNGYSGEEKYIDVNVFNGTVEDFMNYGKQT